MRELSPLLTFYVDRLRCVCIMDDMIRLTTIKTSTKHN